MPAPSSDVPMIRAGNGQCTVWQRFRFTRSIEHLPSIVFFEACERIQAFNKAVLAPPEIPAEAPPDREELTSKPAAES